LCEVSLLRGLGQPRLYDGTTSSSGLVQVMGLQGLDAATGFTQSFTSKNVLGMNGSTLSVNQLSGMVNDGNNGANYTVSFNTAPGTITPAALTISAVTDSRVYNGTTSSSVTPTITSGQVFSGDTANFAEVFVSKNVRGTNASTLAASGSVSDGNGGSNYTVTFQTAQGTITRAQLTIAAVSDQKVFDGTTSAIVSAQVSGLKGADTVSGLAESFASANAGSSAMALGPLTVNDGNGGANYTLTVVNATGTITPAPLTITAHDATQVVGTPDPVFSASFGPFPGGLGPSALDGTLSFTTNAPAGSPGSFKIFAGGLSSSNFDITFVPGTLLVTAANNSLPPVPFSVNQGNGTPAFSLTDPALASLIVKVSDGTGSQTGNAGGPSVNGNLQAPTLDENGNPLGPLISFNSSFIEVCRTRVNLCR
jgi:hypothetical protein